MSAPKKEEEPKFVLGSELRDSIAVTITRIVPNIQYKQLTRLVSEFEVDLERLNELQKEGK